MYRERIELRRTRKFHFRIAEELSDLFSQFSYLLWYLSHGAARVGVTFNYPENPLHALVLPLHKLIDERVPV